MSTYTTKQGDMWDSIAYRELGAARYTPLLMAANTKYRETYIFSAGVVLNLPDVSNAAITQAAALPPWKR